jgi:hypothetical protein
VLIGKRGNAPTAESEGKAMLSPSTLERVSVSYRRGYYDGYDGKATDNPQRDPFDRPFASFDYEQGYKAGANDKRRMLERRAAGTPAAGETV